jgi:hypothetical protein
MPASNDRTIHARTADFKVIVRYDRAGKWYLEGRHNRRRLTIVEAVEMATHRGSRVYLGQPGGRVFDRRVVAAILERAT